MYYQTLYISCVFFFNFSVFIFFFLFSDSLVFSDTEDVVRDEDGSERNHGKFFCIHYIRRLILTTKK